MASITFSGQLDQAMNELSAAGNKILFIPQQNVGDVLEGAASEMTVASDGTYSITLAYNTYSIYHYSDVTKRKRLLADGIVVSSETAVTTIPGLIGSTVPVTEDSVLTIQGYLAEANEAKTDAETAQAATEALFDDFDSSVAESMSLVHTEIASLSIPFNESGRLEYGVGAEYVSGLPVYGADFTRSTSCYYINKSGIIESADVDEIAIGKDGAYFHENFTNEITYPFDLDNSSWTWGGTVALDSTENIGVLTPVVFNPSTSSGVKSALYQTLSFQSGWYTRSIIARSGDLSILNLGSNSSISPTSGFQIVRVDILDGSVLSGSEYLVDINKISDEWYVVTHKFYADSDGVTSACTTQVWSPDGDQSWTPDGTEYIYFGGVQIIYHGETEPASVLGVFGDGGSTSSTITATSCAVPVEGNLPATGYPFTIALDTNVTDTSESGIELITVADQTSTTCLEGISLESDGDVTFSSGTDGQGDVSLGVIFDNAAYVEDSNNRITFAYDEDAETVTCYVNGTANTTGAVSVSGMTLPYDGNLELGNNLNAQMKNVNLYAYTASADEIASWGAPKQ